MKFSIHKMHGCGNDFLIIDGIQYEPPELSAGHIAYLCDRHFGIGADGLVILYPGKKAHASWRFYNCDGSEAELCGNAARCVVRFLEERHSSQASTISIETRAGVVHGTRLENGSYEVALMDKAEWRADYQDKVLRIDKHTFSVFCINTGVPHAVLEVNDIHTYPIARVGQMLVKHSAFGTSGTNVTFFQKESGNTIWSTTFERGVERETFACGTGAVASALIFSELYAQKPPIEVRVPGGTLIVTMSPMSGYLLLQGPVEYVTEIEIAQMARDYEPKFLFGERKK